MGGPTAAIADATAPGYLSARYARALSEFGAPRALPRSGGWLLERDIPQARGRDALGCYPIFACRDWRLLATDLAELQEQLVSVGLVADPFGDHDRALLENCFDFVRPFKEHFIADLADDPQKFLSRNHRYKALRSLRKARVEICREPLGHLDEWHAFYIALIRRHRLTGIKAFSRESFSRQLGVPGLVMFRYLAEGRALAAQLWFIHGEYAYNHLLAMDEAAYELRAAYGLCYEALREFRSGACGPVRLVDLGGGAGLDDPNDGLTQFKRGWSTGTRPVFFCGAILQPQRYAELLQERNCAGATYFPAYRQGEFH